MRKYRLTRITVKTREIVSLSKKAADENENSVCPVCHAPLSASLPAAEKRLVELSPAKASGEQD
jgi:hypothetical protein